MFSRRSSTVGPGFITMKSKISLYAYRQGNSSRKVAQPKSRRSLHVLIEKTLVYIFSKTQLFEVPLRISALCTLPKPTGKKGEIMSKKHAEENSKKSFGFSLVKKYIF